MQNTFGFIGAGNMGGGLARAAARTMNPAAITISDALADKAAALAAELGAQTATVEETAAQCGYIFLGVKPQMLAGLMETLRPILAARTDEFVLVSMIAGVAMADIRRLAGGAYPVIRIMPNTPVAVGEGVILYDSIDVPAEVLAQFCANMADSGLLDPLDEHLIDAGSAISGCGPAFACLFIEAMADGAVACGLPRDKAMRYAAQMLAGTAKLMLTTGQHPGQMKDAVCSPGGSTIAGVRALEQGGFRASAMAAVEAAYVRTKELGK